LSVEQIQSSILDQSVKFYNGLKTNNEKKELEKAHENIIKLQLSNGRTVSASLASLYEILQKFKYFNNSIIWALTKKNQTNYTDIKDRLELECE
jgi:hypothetical protein